MKMLTKKIICAMPRLYETEEIDGPDKIVQVKYFSIVSNWTWYAVEADVVDSEGTYHPLSWINDQLNTTLNEDEPTSREEIAENIQDVIFFGFVEGFEREWGYFSLSELVSARGPSGIPAVERDMYQEPKPLREIRPDLFK